jgi:hypothetical protein
MSDTAHEEYVATYKTGPAGAAYHSAVKLLKARHMEEFSNIVRAERLARGLPAESQNGTVTTEYALRQLEKAEENATKYRALLAERGVTA